ncbi:MAG: 16S rRNA (uracil(1498)-N(3))-methyltransferase [Ruminiclostridium sp.]|nr:16S rRNA (uracil(1498)-N(3))-methyltransferase [Ruminiclostridium sp.]
MSRFFTDSRYVDRDAGKLIIAGDDVNHIKNVLRVVSGDDLVVSDGSGNEYSVRIESFEKDCITAVITNIAPNITEPPVDVTLFQGIPKSDKMEIIILKCVELGVKKIIPVLTERTVVKFKDAKDMENKTARWRRISLEAAKQCNRGIVPLVEMPVKLEKALAISGEYALKIIPYENEANTGIREYIAGYKSGSICIFIGPEGGFDKSEIEKARQSGVRPVTLGPRILRTETAGSAVLSILMYELGDMGV